MHISPYYLSLKILALLTISAVLAGCGQAGAELGDHENTPAPEVSVMLAEPVTREVTNSYPGRLTPFRRAEVRARVAGILLKRLYTEGQEVTEGQTLFEIDEAQLKLDVLTAKSELARTRAEHFKAEDTLRRHQVLLDKNVMREHDFVATVTAEQQAEAAVDNAAAALARAELLLSYARVSAPIAGRAGLALVSEGALVGQGEPTQMTVIEQIDPIYVDFSQSSADLLALDQASRRGELRKIDEGSVEVRLRLPDGSFYPRAGRLIFTDTSVDPETDNVAMRAVFPNPDKSIRPGTYLTVTLTTALNPRVFLLPRDSLLRGAEASHVLIVSEQGLVEKQPVEADELDGKNWVVTAGLKGGEKIIINSAQAAGFEGQRVTVGSIITGGEKLAARFE